ncbi:MAG: B12-binding domain-containing radical SAM protein [Promethearchaeota archaeon]
MKIALLDLNHTTRGITNNRVPLGLGLIATYLRKTVEYKFDIKMFKDVKKAKITFKSWIPDIIGIALYSWNSELNLYIANSIKIINPKCVIIAGGPNLPLISKKKYKFLKNNNFIDICVAYDGEIPFTTIVKRIISGESIESIKTKPSAGTYSLDPNNDKLIESKEQPPRLDSLDDFGAVYAEGVFDEFLKDGFHPFVQTHSGCPFKCAFCHNSDDYYSSLIFQSPKIFKKDIEYLGKWFAGRHEIILYFANANMSLYKQDFAIAKIVREIQEKYDWPRFMKINSGKKPQKLLDLLSIIKYMPAIALQTLTPLVLKNINRVNIPFDEFCTFQQEILRRTGEMPTTELILSLPGETKETFLHSLKKVLNSGVQNVVIYTLMNLKGTPLATEEMSNRFKNKIQYRLIPRQFSTINGHKIFETEEVIISTKDMSFKDYLELREICFTVMSFFGSAELVPLKSLLLELKIDMAKWIFNIHSHISEYPDLLSIYKDFIKETREELFPTKEALIKCYSNPDNYQALISGIRGDNLIRKSKYIILSENYSSYLKLAINEARKLINEKLGNNNLDKLIDDLEQFLSYRNMKSILSGEILPTFQNITLTYDIPEWLKNPEGKKLLSEYKGLYSYKVKFSSDIRKKLNDFKEMNKEMSLSLQITYRDGLIRDFWPLWKKI